MTITPRFGLTNMSAAAEVAQLLGFNEKTIKRTDYTFAGLERTIGPALNSVPLDLIIKYFRRVREYARGYREGFTAGPELEQYK